MLCLFMLLRRLIVDCYFRPLTLAKALDIEAGSSGDESARGSDQYLATDDDGEVGYQ